MHPGCGFLAENAEFAQAVLDAGLIWIGPPPAAIDALGADKIERDTSPSRWARRWCPAPPTPVADADAVVAFADEHGLPIAIKAAYGAADAASRSADGRRSRPPTRRPARRSPRSAAASASSSATWTARASRPSAWPTATATSWSSRPGLLAAARHQKLVEEAPAPFGHGADRAAVHGLQGDSDRGRLRRRGDVRVPGRSGRDDLFLEVNTRLQVEHPVSEEVTGLDLVREMFRIAEGEAIGYDGPTVTRHSIEFRINAEDAGRNFMPAPGTSVLAAAVGPGRVDEGYRAGMTVPGGFDSLVAKIIVTGADRTQALARSGAPCASWAVEACRPGAVPPGGARRPGLRGRRRELRGAYALDRDRVRRRDRPVRRSSGGRTGAGRKSTVVVEVNGKRLEVVMPAGLGAVNGYHRAEPAGQARTPRVAPAAEAAKARRATR